MKIKETNKIIRDFLLEKEESYSAWKKANVTLRGISDVNVQDNNRGAAFGKGLYSVPLSNKSMAKEYGEIHFLVNAKPKKPKVFSTLNQAEIFLQQLIDEFCKENNVRYSRTFFEKNTSIEEQMLKRNYDGLIIKGREMVNYSPKDVKYFKDERQLKNYYQTKK